MPRKKKYWKYGFDTKITTIKFPKLGEDRNKELRNLIDNAILSFLNGNTISNSLNKQLLDKLILLMIKAKINSEKYGVDINEFEIQPSIKRLKEGGRI